MSNPKHPAKIVIVIRDGEVDLIFADKQIDATIFVANYDPDHDEYGEHEWPKNMVDAHGENRWLDREKIIVDTAMVRNILNKRGDKS